MLASQFKVLIIPPALQYADFHNRNHDDSNPFQGLLVDGADGGPDMASLIQQSKSQCPSSKIIASGYSQGAEVVHDALSTASIAALVDGAVLFGDPNSKNPVGALPDDQVKRFCVPGDLICETGALIVDASHLSYALYASQAASAARGFAGV